MELRDLLNALVEQKNKGGCYQIHLNSGNLEQISSKECGIEFGDLYFKDCHLLENTSLLCFGNTSREPIGQKEDGTNLYSVEMNSCLYVDVNKIETIEDLAEFDDWFTFPSSRVINVYMLSEKGNANRNVLTIGFM